MALDNFDTAMGFAAVMLLLSLLVTVLVQMTVAILGLRARNLAWGVKTLLLQIDPTLKEKATNLANRVLKHPSVSHTWSRTTALRPRELVLILEDVVKNPTKHKLDLAQNDTLKKLIHDAAPAVSAQQAGQALQVVDELSKIFPQQVEAVRGAVDRALRAKSALEQSVHQWFDTVMDRTTERFLVHTRIATVAFGFALAFVLHVDSIHIVRELSASKELRAAFVAMADATLKQSEQAQKVSEQSVVASAVIQALAANVKEPERAAALKTVPASVRSREEGLNWLTAKFPDDAKRAELLVAYSEGFQRASLDRVKELSDTAKDLRKSLEERLIKITPREPKWTPQHVVGMVITALFLSLGAPFWFNALRNLSNLRPVIAAKVEGRNAA
jgi:hypothetical protein